MASFRLRSLSSSPSSSSSLSKTMTSSPPALRTWAWPLLQIVLASAILISPATSSTANTVTVGYSIDSLRNIFSSAVLSATSSSSSTKNDTTTSLDGLSSVLRLDWSSQTSDAASQCLGNVSMSEEQAARCLVSKGKCVTLGDLSDLYVKDRTATLTPSETDALCPALLYHMVSCEHNLLQDQPKEESPSSVASWGYSFLFVTVINLLSITGALVLPCMASNSYKVILMFLVALAVGTLAGSGLLFLIPEAFELGDDQQHSWKATTIMGGIYLFFLLEKLLRSINNKRENTRLKKRQDEKATAGQITSSFTRKAIDNVLPERDLDTAIENMHTEGICSAGYRAHEANSDRSLPQAQLLSSAATTPDDVHPKMNGSGMNGHHSSHTSSQDDDDQVAPVAYMIIFGDALHNFIDGLSIGSAFTKSIMTGISISVAVMCEELPHELGDFAILLNSGMRVRKALCYNFLSALTCYLGTAIGIMLGENTHSHTWIFALAGGMFLYISLVDMLPEMNAAAESPEGIRLGSTKVFIIHNLGLLSGFGIMLIFALYGHNISFE